MEGAVSAVRNKEKSVPTFWHRYLETPVDSASLGHQNHWAMRALKSILIILLALVAILVVLGLMGQSEFRVERSAVIKAPVEVVYANVSSFNAMDKWAPWKEREHHMTFTMSGSPDGAVGAISHWKSDESEGEQELAELVPNTSVRTELRFISPFATNSEGTFDLDAMGDSTRVTWGMQGTNSFVGKIGRTFTDMEKEVGPLLEKGLANLKGIAEQEAITAKEKHAPRLEIVTAARAATLYFGERKRVKLSELKAFYSETLMKSIGIIQKAGVQPIGAPSGVYFERDEKNQEADLLAGFPVPADAKNKLKGMTFYATPAAKTYQIAYYGGYTGIDKAHGTIDARMSTEGVELNANVIEEYVTDPGQEQDSTKWLTNVIYLIK